jgi:hypothetical protein
LPQAFVCEHLLAPFCSSRAPVETDAEARKALSLLRLDPDDSASVQRLLGFRVGRCCLRDFEGRVVPMQVEPPDWMMRLDTTPR